MQITALATHKYPRISFQWCNELNSRSTKRPPRQLYSAKSFFIIILKENGIRGAGKREQNDTHTHAHTGQTEHLKRRLYLPPCCLGYHEPQWGQQLPW